MPRRNTSRCIAAFSGPYPYSKFALVENFWETGYGMPSFTLLGEQIIRFPFILTSSYPHELLHNWWGNGVFVDFAGGNWCEGLTAYLADHLIAEQRGQGADHRRAILQRVTNYVTPENDFPLSRFQSRHDAVTEAVGYGKTAMVFNMLREKVGDAQFIKALQAFYRDNRFREASFDDIRKSFEAVSGLDLRPFFDQWVKEVGTPELKLDSAAGRGQRLDITLSQVQPGRLFALDVPVVIETDKGVETRTVSMPSDRARVDVSFDLQGTAQRVEIDPQFQVYRRLSPFEIPPSLSKAFGAKKVLIVMSAHSAPRLCGSRQGMEPRRRRDRHATANSMPCRPIAPSGCSARTTSSRRWWRKRSRPMAHRSMQPGCARPTPLHRGGGTKPRRRRAPSATTRIRWSFMFRRRARPPPMRWRASCPITASIPGWYLPATRQPTRPPASGRSATRRLPQPDAAGAARSNWRRGRRLPRSSRSSTPRA